MSRGRYENAPFRVVVALLLSISNVDALDRSPIFTTVIVLNALTSYFCDLGPEYSQIWVILRNPSSVKKLTWPLELVLLL